MPDPVVAQSGLPATLTAIGTLIAAVGAFVVSWRNSKHAGAAKEAAARAAIVATDAKTEIIATKQGVFEVGNRIDGRLTELLKVTEASARALGIEEGRAAERADQAKDKKKRGG